MAGVKDTLEVLGESLYTGTEQDNKPSRVRDVIVVEVGSVYIIVFTDWSNKCVKTLFSKDNNGFNSRLQLNEAPSGITQFGDNHVMLSLPYINKIVTIAVTPDLVHVTHCNTRKQYHSLAVLSASRLAAGCFESVDILNMQGELLRSLTSKGMMFCRPWYMCVNHVGHLIVSDSGMDKVTCLTLDGQMVWKYSGRHGRKIVPVGITLRDNGNILVADQFSRKVIELSESGKFVREVLTSEDGFSCPLDICVDHQGSLFLCDVDSVASSLVKFVFPRK